MSGSKPPPHHMPSWPAQREFYLFYKRMCVYESIFPCVPGCVCARTRARGYEHAGITCFGNVPYDIRGKTLGYRQR